MSTAEIPMELFSQQEIARENDLGSHAGAISSNEPIAQQRVRQYTDDPNRERWVVFIRRIDKKIRVKQVTNDLIKNYPSVIFITEVNRDKLRIVFTNHKEANSVVNDDRFRLEYRVYVPARVVEIDGVVTSDSLSVSDFEGAKGMFKNPKLPSVKIVDVQQLNKAVESDSNLRYTPSGSFRITFEGSALPHYVIMDKVLRLRVRLYAPKVMTCTNCKQLGHTKNYCSNKPKCLKCGGLHNEESCQKNVEKCVLCGQDPHDKKDCPKFKSYSAKIKRSANERSKRTYAELLKKTFESDNMFSELSGSDMDSDFETEYDSLPSQGGKRRRKHTSFAKVPTNSRKNAHVEKESKTNKSHSFAPNSVRYQKEFPILPGTSKEFVQDSDRQDPFRMQKLAFSGILKLSTIVRWALDTLNAPNSIQSIVQSCIPTIAEFGKQLAIKWPLLSVIDFDG